MEKDHLEAEPGTFLTMQLDWAPLPHVHRPPPPLSIHLPHVLTNYKVLIKNSRNGPFNSFIDLIELFFVSVSCASLVK